MANVKQEAESPSTKSSQQRTTPKGKGSSNSSNNKDGNFNKGGKGSSGGGYGGGRQSGGGGNFSGGSGRQQHQGGGGGGYGGQRPSGGQRQSNQQMGQRFGNQQDNQTPLPLNTLNFDETVKKDKKFTQRCRLFVGNLTNDIEDEEFKKMFEKYGEISEVFLNKQRGFGFIRLDTRQNAEAAKAALDGTTRKGRQLRVRFATHGAALKVKHLPPLVSNELLEHAFSQFGIVERAVVIVDDRGKATGEGIVEFARKPGAQNALAKIKDGVFLLTSCLRPISVEVLEQKDEEDGLPEKNLSKNQNYQRERDGQPRFAPPSSFEFEWGLRWKEIYELETSQREQLEKQFEERREKLESEMDGARYEHQTIMMRQDLQRRQEELRRMEENFKEIEQRRQEEFRQRSELRNQELESMRQRQEEVTRRRQDDMRRRAQGVDPSMMGRGETAMMQGDSMGPPSLMGPGGQAGGMNNAGNMMGATGPNGRQGPVGMGSGGPGPNGRQAMGNTQGMQPGGPGGMPSRASRFDQPPQPFGRGGPGGPMGGSPHDMRGRRGGGDREPDVAFKRARRF
ncbi:paraspeckle component 1-like [Anneissia japonica]|uniref:paraspeckle component 1-like n=1 Tax=Anneissia japonica TaxID=1529436 RepID=UPI00142565C7|nr:paraspeckle component 1-like [Anneissia japonica]